MPKYVSYDEMMEILDNKYLLPFRKDERLRGLNGIDIVRCKDCRHANECHKSVQYTRNGPEQHNELRLLWLRINV